MVRHPRRYPKYRADYASIAFCDTFEAAEALMKEIVRTERYNMDDVYCFYIYERVMDVLFDRSEYTKCWLFDAKGEIEDKRLFPSYWSEKEFDGRSEDEIRFKWGDLVELYDGDYVKLVFVLAPPTGKEHYKGRDYKDSDPYEYYAKSKDRLLIHPDTAKLLETMLVYLKEHGEEKTLKYIKKHILSKKTY